MNEMRTSGDEARRAGAWGCEHGRDGYAYCVACDAALAGRVRASRDAKRVEDEDEKEGYGF